MEKTNNIRVIYSKPLAKYIINNTDLELLDVVIDKDNPSRLVFFYEDTIELDKAIIQYSQLKRKWKESLNKD